MASTEANARSAVESDPRAGDAARELPEYGDHTSNHIVRSILRYLEDRQLQPGDRLPSERALAEQLGVGRNALREAIATLTALRVVESRPNSGIYLKRISMESSFETLVLLAVSGATPTPEEIAETVEVRATLELAAVRYACKRRDDGDLARMAEILARTEAALAQGVNIVECDTEFHLALVAASHNSVLVRVLNAFYRMTALRRKAIFASESHGRASADDHRMLFDAIGLRDVEEAQEQIRRHMDRARSYWQVVLGE